ncbi:hypothetical protein [Priestia megaterium]|uniref:hypothetical protein n=1 Tax=Priestia megaterium TaxID=1404 RepID=UPI0023DB7AED|nr:hypothetical protein [Priestia megaterium]MDF2010222.1 hypothetical protein [Priestia megaterium]
MNMHHPDFIIIQKTIRELLRLNIKKNEESAKLLFSLKEYLTFLEEKNLVTEREFHEVLGKTFMEVGA